MPNGESRSSKPHWLIFAAIFFIEVVQFSSSIAGFPGPWRYYAYQWTVSYDNGFTRRGLPGAVLRLLHLDNGNFLLIAILGWIVTLALFVVVVKLLQRLLAPLEPMTRNVLLIAILLSPATTGLLVQATGDPIQLIILAYIALVLFVLKPSGNVVLATLTFLVFGVLTILIHEATVFFIGPALLLSAFLIRRSRLDRAALLGYIIGAAPMLLVVIRLTENHTAAAIAPMHIGSTPMIATYKLKLDTFSSLLAEENAIHFHSGIKGYILTVRNAVGGLLLPLFFAFVLSRVLPRRRVLLAFLFPLLLSLPLWLIAHDWGRFSSYLFVLSLIALMPGASESNPPVPVQALQPFFLGILLILSGITTTRITTLYIIKGVGDDNPTLVVAMFLCAIALWFLLRRQQRPGELAT